MRIAYVCADPGVPVFGTKGCSIHVQEVVRALLGHGARPYLFSSRPAGGPARGLETVPVVALPCASSEDPAARERESLAANDDLRAALERAGPFDLVYERYSLWGHAGMEFARAAGVPGVLEVNAPLIDEQAAYRVLADAPAATAVAERAFGAARVIIAVSEGVARYLEGFPAARGKIHVVPNGVDPDRFPETLAPSLPPEPGTFTVGFVGTLKAWHGLPNLVESFDRFHRREPASRLLIVGDGPERATLEKELRERRLQGASILTGAVRPDDIPGLLASMDVGVAPYPPREDFYFSPLKVFEYMAAGLPVAASRIGQLAGLIRDGENGLLVPPGDSEALSSTLLRLQRDPGLRARLGTAAREDVRKERSWAAVAERILRLAGLVPPPLPPAAGSRTEEVV